MNNNMDSKLNKCIEQVKTEDEATWKYMEQKMLKQIEDEIKENKGGTRKQIILL